MLMLYHMIEQLDLAVLFWRNLGLAAECETSPYDPEEQARAVRLFDISRFAGYRLCIEADAWRLVCAEMNVDPTGMLAEMLGWETIQRTEEAARVRLWTREEVEAFLKKSGREDIEVPTVERAAQSMREFIEYRAKW